jgi:hypothetical protein
LAAFFRHGIAGTPASHAYNDKEEIRLRLGRWLALGLEFLLAADILRTAVAPIWNEIGQLAAIAVLRTALNYFLQKEIDKVEERERSRARVLMNLRKPPHDHLLHQRHPFRRSAGAAH